MIVFSLLLVPSLVHSQSQKLFLVISPLFLSIVTLASNFLLILSRVVYFSDQTHIAIVPLKLAVAIQFILSLKQVSSYQDSAPCLSSPPAPGGPPTSATWAGASPYDTACLPPPTLCPGCPSAWNALPGASRRVWFLRPLRLSLDTGSTRQPSLVPPRAA